MTSPSCHPERKYFAKSMCEPCYKQNWSEQNRDKTRTAQLKYKLNNPDKDRENRRKEYLRNREQKRKYAKNRNADPNIKLKNKDRTLSKRYGIGLDKYQELFSVQQGACAICEKTNGFGGMGHNLRIDHDHENNKIRGLLCNRCNTGLGYIENKDWFIKALIYLRKYD